MPCFRPVHAWRGVERADGKAKMVFRPPSRSEGTYVPLPCNGCVGCRLEYSRQWAMRCMDEASLYPRNSFITLTFDDKHLPLNRGLDKSHFQRFMKRLRKFSGGHMIRYFHAGEYGALHGRPHYHSLLFNYDFPDRVYLKTTESGEMIYTSASLKAVWPYGYSSVGDVTFGSAAYVARYHLKKVGSVVSKNHYLDKRTGEMLPPEYVTMSRGDHVRGTGGIGRGWFEKFHSDVYPNDARVIKGLDTKPCRFYDKQYEKLDPVGFATLKCDRVSSASARLDDNTPDRLAVKEQVKLAQIKILSTSKEI